MQKTTCTCNLEKFGPLQAKRTFLDYKKQPRFKKGCPKFTIYQLIF